MNIRFIGYLLIGFVLSVLNSPVRAESDNGQIKIEPMQKIDPIKIDPMQKIDPLVIEPMQKLKGTVEKPDNAGAETTTVEKPKLETTETVDVPTIQLDNSGHSQGSSSETSAIISNIIDQEKKTIDLPSAESLGVGGPKVTDFEVKVPEIKNPERNPIQVQVPEPPNFRKSAKRNDPANAGGGGC